MNPLSLLGETRGNVYVNDYFSLAFCPDGYRTADTPEEPAEDNGLSVNASGALEEGLDIISSEDEFVTLNGTGYPAHTINLTHEGYPLIFRQIFIRSGSSMMIVVLFAEHEEELAEIQSRFCDPEYIPE